MTMHPDLRALLSKSMQDDIESMGAAWLTSADITAFAVAVLKKAEAECDANAQVFLQQDKNGRYAGALRCAEDVHALALCWQEFA